MLQSGWEYIDILKWITIIIYIIENAPGEFRNVFLCIFCVCLLSRLSFPRGFTKIREREEMRGFDPNEKLSIQNIVIIITIIIIIIIIITGSVEGYI